MMIRKKKDDDGNPLVNTPDSEHLVGTWNVEESETVTGSSDTYVAKIKKS